MKILCLTLLCAVAITRASPIAEAPQQLSIQKSTKVEEVKDPDEKRRTLDKFSRGSVLYRSLIPEGVQGGELAYELVVEVESPALRLTKPENVIEKRRRLLEAAAERRTSENV